MKESKRINDRIVKNATDLRMLLDLLYLFNGADDMHWNYAVLQKSCVARHHRVDNLKTIKSR